MAGPLGPPPGIAAPVRTAAGHRRSGGTAAGHVRTALGTCLRASDRPARTATRGDRSRLPGHRRDRSGRTTATPGLGRSRAATRSYRASRPTTRPRRTVQGGTRGSGRPAARIAGTRGPPPGIPVPVGPPPGIPVPVGPPPGIPVPVGPPPGARAPVGPPPGARVPVGPPPGARAPVGPPPGARAPVGPPPGMPVGPTGRAAPVVRSGRTNRGQLRRRLADCAIARVVRFSPAAIHSIAAAAVCRPTAHAVIGVTTAAEGRTHAASNSPGDRRPRSARRARHRASGRRARSSRGRRRPTSAAEPAAVAAGLLRIAGPSPSGGSVVARTHWTVTAHVGLDHGLLARATEPSAGAATRGRPTALSKGLTDAGAAQTRHARAQSAEPAQVRRGAGIPGARSLGGHVTRRHRAGRTASAGRARIGSRIAVVAPVAGRLTGIRPGISVRRPRHAEPGEAAGAFGRPVRCSMA